MDREELHQLVINQLIAIAPELEGEVLNEYEDIQESFKLDAADFRNLVIGVGRRTQTDIYESDYSKVHTINAMLDYLEKKQ